MQVDASCAARLTFETDGVAWLQPLPYLDEIARMVTVERLQTIGVTQDDAVSVSKEGT